QIDLVAHEIARRIENNAVKRVVIDAATDVQEGAADRDRYREFLYSLTQMFAQRNVTSMLIAEATESQSWNYGISASEVARMSDNIIQLELRLTAGLDRMIRVVKSRGSAHDGRRLPLHITARGITVG
ncbi:MAG: RAD55 family ATPase, partial [Candidatus Binatia bacterium]